MRNDFLGGALAAILLYGFSGAALARDVVVSNDDAGKTVSVAQGDTLIVKLTGKHDTGYYWRIDADPTPHLILSGRTTESVAVMGAPETTTFSYTIGEPGEVMFRASYLKAGVPLPDKSDIAIMIDVTPKS